MNAREPESMVVGIGQIAAGDDGVGLLVARRLATWGVPTIEATDATVVLALLAEGRRIVVVDAVVGSAEPGSVLHLRPEELAEVHSPVSSHGLGVAAALALASVLHGPDVLRSIAIVGVIVDGEPRLGSKLSAAVAAAVSPAADLAARLASTIERAGARTRLRPRRGAPHH